MHHHIYTYSANAQAEKYIQASLHAITKAVVADVERGHIRALVLLGGYGKGEGGVKKVGEEYRPHNNFDLMLVSAKLSKRKREALNQQLSAKLNALGERLDIGIDLSVLDEQQLENMPTRVLWYDMKKGHKTLYGDSQFIPSIQHLRSEIPAWDMRNLMVNRGSLLLINLVCLQNQKRSESINRLIVKHAMKAIIGYGDSLLYALGEYHWSYKEKHKRLLKHPGINLNFKRLYDEAMAFRWSPKYDYYLHKDIEKWHNDLIRQLEKVHLQCEAIRLGEENLSWNNYLEIALRASLLERGISLKEFARKCLNLLQAKHGQLPTNLSFTNRIAYRLSDKETLLPLIFPYMAFNPEVHRDQPQLLSFFTSHFGTPSSESLANVIKAYLGQWGAAFDQNLKAVLMKNQIAL